MGAVNAIDRHMKKWNTEKTAAATIMEGWKPDDMSEEEFRKKNAARLDPLNRIVAWKQYAERTWQSDREVNKLLDKMNKGDDMRGRDSFNGFQGVHITEVLTDRLSKGKSQNLWIFRKRMLWIVVGVQSLVIAVLFVYLFATLTTGNTRKRCFGQKSWCNCFTLCLYRLHFIESYVTTIANALFVLVAAVLLLPLYVGGDTSAWMVRCEKYCHSIEFEQVRPLEYVLSAIKYQIKWANLTESEDNLEDVSAEDRAWFFFAGCLLLVFAQAHLTMIMHSNIKLASQLRNLEEDELVQLIDDPKLHRVVDIRSTPSLDV